MDSKNQSIAIVGAGPAGCACAYFAMSNNVKNITFFDIGKPLQTLLYTGGGRCNLAYAEYDFKELAKFYPRGEKFLYSVFSRFSTCDTIDFFQKIGVDIYEQDDSRLFPKSNSANEVKRKFLNSIEKCNFKKEKVLKIIKVEDGFFVSTDLSSYTFDKIVIAVGGHAGFALIKNLGHKIIEPKPALVGLVSAKNFKQVQGVSLKKVFTSVYFKNKLISSIKDDLIFTQTGISGPLAYKISSICARLNYSISTPILAKLDFVNKDLDFQILLNSNPKKNIKNLVAEFLPKSLAEFILNTNKIDLQTKCCDINAKLRDLISQSLTNFEIKIISPAKEGEIVTSGGVCLDEIDSKTMESKLISGLYFCGEVIDIDGFCGGFNLQNCWSTGFVVGNSL